MKKNWNRDGKYMDRDGAVQAARIRLWKSMLEDFELSWLKDVPASRASLIIDLTLRKMRENRSTEEAWRMFIGERAEI